jgi:molybdopterin converting factor small subunit
VIRVELYDVARRLAGRERVDVVATTIGEALLAAVRACPGLAEAVLADGRPSPHFRVSVGGARFVEDPATVLADGDSLVVISAQAGG